MSNCNVIHLKLNIIKRMYIEPLSLIVKNEILQARILQWVSLSLLQGIFPTQGSNPGLLHCRQILYQLSHQGSPSILYTYSVFITRDYVVKYMYSYFCFSISYIFFSILTLYINYSLWHWVILLINILPARWGSYVTLLQSSYL